MKQQNKKSISENLSSVAAGIIIPLFIICIAIGEIEQQRANIYKPGHSVKKKERVMINALQDSVLNARIAKYNELRQEYKDARDCAIAPNAHTQFMDRPVHPYCQRKMRDVYYAPRTLRVYKMLLDQYAQDSVEGRYHELRNMLASQKQK